MSARPAVAWTLGVMLLAGCGKKGPPLPPLVRVPAAPADLVVERRADRAHIRFLVPAANTDGTRPADIDRVDVYAFDGAVTGSGEDALALGTRVASVDVKAPRDPDQTIGADDPDSDLPIPEGPGLDQGATAHVTVPVSSAQGKSQQAFAGADVDRTMPLLMSPFAAVARAYAAVGVSTRGRRGPLSARATIPMAPAPEPPGQPAVAFDERRVVVTWTPAGRDAGTQPAAPAGVDVLPSRPVGPIAPAVGYHVYETAQAAPENPPVAGGGAIVERRLTKEPVAAPEFADERVEWGAERCYTVTTVHRYAALAVESVPAPSRCVTFKDTFPPATPGRLTAIGAEASITLIWEPAMEADLAGYLVLRGAPGADLTAVTPAPISGTQFTDAVPTGTRFAYAVQAVDTAGNASPPTARVEAAAR